MLVAGFLGHLASKFAGLFTVEPHRFTSRAFDARPICLRQFSQHGHFLPPDTASMRPPRAPIATVSKIEQRAHLARQPPTRQAWLPAMSLAWPCERILVM